MKEGYYQQLIQVLNSVTSA